LLSSNKRVLIPKNSVDETLEDKNPSGSLSYGNFLLALQQTGIDDIEMKRTFDNGVSMVVEIG